MTGHTSLLVASEAVTGLALNVAKPVFKGQAEEVEVTREAEVGYRKFIDDGLKQTVWQNNFCTSVSVLSEHPSEGSSWLTFCALSGIWTSTVKMPTAIRGCTHERDTRPMAYADCSFAPKIYATAYGLGLHVLQ